MKYWEKMFLQLFLGKLHRYLRINWHFCGGEGLKSLGAYRVLKSLNTRINEIKIDEVRGTLNINMQLEIRATQSLSGEVMSLEAINLKVIHTRLSCWMHFYLFLTALQFPKNLGGPFWFTLECWYVEHESVDLEETHHHRTAGWAACLLTGMS